MASASSMTSTISSTVLLGAQYMRDHIHNIVQLAVLWGNHIINDATTMHRITCGWIAVQVALQILRAAYCALSAVWRSYSNYSGRRQQRRQQQRVQTTTTTTTSSSMQDNTNHRRAREAFGRPQAPVPIYIDSPPLQHLLPDRLPLLTGGAKRARPPGRSYGNPPRFVDTLEKVYDPPGEFDGHCLFACLLSLAGININMESIQELRTANHNVLYKLQQSGARVCGRTIGEWLPHDDIDNFICNTLTTRYGTTLDLIVCASCLNIPLWLLSSTGQIVVHTTARAPTLTIVHEREHFYITKNPYINHNIDIDHVHHLPIHTTQPIMENLLCRKISRRTRHLEAITTCRTFQTYSKPFDAYIASMTATPAFSYATLQTRPAATLYIVINNSDFADNYTMELPNWCAYTYNHVEVNTCTTSSEARVHDLMAWAYFQIMTQVRELTRDILAENDH
eukprot:2458312-Amphidinium_carterae.1